MPLAHNEFEGWHYKNRTRIPRDEEPETLENRPGKVFIWPKWAVDQVNRLVAKGMKREVAVAMTEGELESARRVAFEDGWRFYVID